MSSKKAESCSGGCPECPIIADFDASKRNLDSCSADYGYVSPTEITVKNRGVNSKSGKESTIEGTAKVVDVKAPNRLQVLFPMSIFGLKVFNSKGNYEVWATDYNTYSLVYSCAIVLGKKFEFGWILSRTKTLPEERIQELKAMLASKGVDVSKFTKTKQE